MTLEHDERPWGYTVLDEGADYKVKRITVHAGKRLSNQRHAPRFRRPTRVRRYNQ
jgi:mannose-6-phosphate isomerase-like protein (cupin superfamily)